MKLVLILFLLSSFPLLTSCGGSSGGDGDQLQENTGGSTGGDGAEIIFDSELSEAERQALKESTSAIANYDIDGSQVSRFSQIFGGNRSSSVVKFFEERVNYGLSENTDLIARLVIQPGPAFSQTDLAIIANNPSSGLWFASKLSEPDDLKIKINNQLIDINSSRIGVMRFGTNFTVIETVQQAIVLVHEARHSDCTGGILASDLERLRNQTDMIENTCGHAHDLCSDGPYAGQFACDSHPWGAYAVSAVYSLAIADTCTNCSETDKAIAMTMHFDSASRFLIFNYEDMLNGEFGSPDMSSSNEVRQDL